MRTAVTVSLVEEARGGPFVFWDGLEHASREAAAIGFDAIEIFPPGADAIDQEALKDLLSTYQIQVAAVGTGAGWVKHRLTLTSPEEATRVKAREFVKTIIDVAGNFQAPAIIGSMQGRFGDDVSKEQALNWLGESLSELGAYAQRYGVPLLYEPLNRYETNLCATLADGTRLLDSLDSDNVRLLADLFHMNIEETDLAVALREAGAAIGHVHFVDSNRRPAGAGHLQLAPIVAALREMNYAGYLSAEAFPWPNPQEAAQLTMDTFRELTS